MKEELFILIFADGEKIKEWAWSLEEARILAQAERIKQGKPYKIINWHTANEYSYHNTCDGECDTCSRQHVCAD